MAINEQRVVTAPAAPLVADPGPLGLAAFALTTFVLSAHNAGLFGFDKHANTIVIGLAIFYGGLAQFMAGMWAFRNRNTFSATAFSTYGGFWLALGTYLALAAFGKVVAGDILVSLGWFVLGFAIFNTYMMFWALRVNVAVFAVFATLELTEILLFWGFFGGNVDLIHWGGYLGVITALVAWYTSAADVINSMGTRPFLPVGTALWRESAIGSSPVRSEPAPVRR
jgi:succinate-acetate transporter protein